MRAGGRWRWGGPLAVAAVIAVLWLGLPAVNGAVSSERPVDQGTSFDVGNGARVTMPDGGWAVDTDRTQLGLGVGLVRDETSVGLQGGAFDGTADELQEGFLDSVKGKQGYQVIESGIVVETAGGLSGLRTFYASSEREGVYTVLVGGGTAVEVVARGPIGSLASLDSALDDLLDTITVVAV
jgi:hypothetical protein